MRGTPFTPSHPVQTSSHPKERFHPIRRTPLTKRKPLTKPHASHQAANLIPPARAIRPHPPRQEKIEQWRPNTGTTCTQSPNKPNRRAPSPPRREARGRPRAAEAFWRDSTKRPSRSCAPPAGRRALCGGSLQRRSQIFVPGGIEAAGRLREGEVLLVSAGRG